jgi:hypothetical protein
MVLADRLWPAGSRPLRLSGSLPTGLAGWVARRPDGSLGVLLVNSDLNQANRIVLDTPAGQAILGRLQAAGASAVTLDGQQLVWASGRPSWKGHRRLERPPVRAGRLTVRLTPGSAAWLVLRAPPAGRSTRTPAG